MSEPEEEEFLIVNCIGYPSHLASIFASSWISLTYALGRFQFIQSIS